MAFYSVGQNNLRVPMSLHAENRQRLCKLLQNQAGGLEKVKNEYIVLEGGPATSFHSSDAEPLFVQESFFHWAFGVYEPDYFGVIKIEDGTAYLFGPKLPESYLIWLGHIASLEEIKQKYAVDAAFYVEDLLNFLKEKQGKLHVLNGFNTDSGIEHKPASFSGIEQFEVDKTKLYQAMVNCRQIKSQAELEVLRYANRIASEAHKSVMKSCKPGMHEYQLESIFSHYIYFNGGCRRTSYTSICASGENSSILHYGHAGAPNDKQIKDGDMMLMDMGAAYHRYPSDITCSFPANGKFTPEQKFVYEVVLTAQKKVLSILKPGVCWFDMHLLTNQIICEEFLKADLLKGTVEELMENNISSFFFPHGLGHFLGLDVHDVGGYESGEQRSQKLGYKSLRTNKVLKEGMLITVEPGVYFIRSLLEKAINDETTSRFFNKEKITKFLDSNFGGVRIEDNVYITADGIENLTNCPRTVEEIEQFMTSN
eukprot:TRINITY_DN1333_c2_g1_i1.p1 TRINITY_DN1333_c2_g1~~TRINITY_DN1333_c2_g1_i1.p1  ORF type:complete len:482 (-),score=225.46 TRINITY_DN1333_c2_g1_i1:51-1496(-)